MPRKIKNESEAYNKILPQRLRELMVEKDGTHDALAAVLGVQRQTVTNYCNGVSSPTWEALVIIANYFGVSLDYLLGRTEAKSPDRPDIRAACDYTGLTEKAVEYLHRSKESDGGVLEGVNYLFDAAPEALHGVFSPIATAVLLGSMPPESENRKIIAGSLAMTPQDLMHYWAARAGDQVKAITLEQAKRGGKRE